MDEQLVVIREYESITPAEMAKSILDAEGIYPVGAMPAQLVVREEDAEWASALLTSMETR